MDAGEGLPTSADIGDDWLGKAVVHLAAACGAPAGAGGEAAPLSPVRERGDGGGAAFLRRLDASRMCVLCSALAAEAFVNEFVHARGPGYRHTLERLPVPERFGLAARLLGASDRLAPGTALQVRIARLFELSAELVNPRRAAGTAAAVYAEMFQRFNPRSALDAVKTSAEAAEALAQLYSPPFRTTPGLALRAVAALADSAEEASAIPVPSPDELQDERLAFPAEEIIGA